MRCRFTFTVVSDVALPASVCFQRGVTEFTFRLEKGRFTALVVEQAGVKMVGFGRLVAAPPGGIGQVIMPSDPLLPFVQMELRAIRGSLALWGVSDIDIDHPLVEWLPESEEEKKALTISSFRYGNTPPGTRPPRVEPIDQLIRPFLSWQGFLPVEIPLEYFRRGAEDLAKGHYIEAIYDFYFVFEFLFAGGKFTKHAVREAILASAEAKRVIAESQKFDMAEIRENPADLARFNDRYRNRTVEEVIDTLTDLRGLLHHQSQTRKQHWHPAAPEQFKVDAYFLCAAAHSAVLNLSTSLLFTPEAEAKFDATPLSTPDGRKITLKPIPEPPGAEQFTVPSPNLPKPP